MNADVAELADAPDLGSGVPDVQVQVLSSAPNSPPGKKEACRVVFFTISSQHDVYDIMICSGCPNNEYNELKIKTLFLL